MCINGFMPYSHKKSWTTCHLLSSAPSSQRQISYAMFLKDWNHNLLELNAYGISNLGTIHFRRQQIFTIFDPNPPPVVSFSILSVDKFCHKFLNLCRVESNLVFLPRTCHKPATERFPGSSIMAHGLNRIIFDLWPSWNSTQHLGRWLSHLSLR